MRVQYDVMVQEFTRVLEKRGFNHEDAENAAVIFAQNSLAGVFSHGVFRVLSAIWKKGRSIRMRKQPVKCRWEPSRDGTGIVDSGL
mgnify:CR=1 FL=1